MSRPTFWILGGIFLIVLGICIAGAVLTIAADNEDVDVNLGDDEAIFHDVTQRAQTISDEGPTAVADPYDGSRPILLQHLGDDPTTGWLALLAVAPGSQSCAVNWDADDEVFRDCEGETYPPDGTGLDQFPTRVEDDALYVDLGRGPSSEPPESTTTSTILVTGG